MNLNIKLIKTTLSVLMLLSLLLTLFMPLYAFAAEDEQVTDAMAADTAETASPSSDAADAVVVPDLTDRTPMEAANEARASGAASNRFNVMMVMDASASMSYSDPHNLRFDAMNLFTNLLADEGNVLGGEVFSTAIDREVELRPVSGQAAKDEVVHKMSTVWRPSGWTNIGRGLNAAADELEENGSKDLPSVIILLSDGNTAMISKGLENEAREGEKEAVQRLKEAEIPVYSVCLNVNGSADISEMEFISHETGGESREVRNARDLNEVFQMFYSLIYGVKRIELYDDVFPEDGRLETPFDVPGFAVEEVNIIIQGDASSITLLKPNGSEGDAERHSYETFTALKITDIVPGVWTLVTEGVPGDRIKIEVVYNTNLRVHLFTDEWITGEELLPVLEPITFYVKLTAGDIEAVGHHDYSGFDADLVIMDEYEEEIRRVPMEVGQNWFEVSELLEEGEYWFEASVEALTFSRASNRIGPLVFGTPAPEPEPEPIPNTPPTASQSSLKKTVLIWPVAGGKWDADVGALIRDKEDTILRYSIVDSTFPPTASCLVDAGGRVSLRLGNFQLKGGSVTVRATDSEGLFCDARLDAKVINTVVILLGLLAVALVAALVYFLMRLREGREKPVGGSVTVSTECNGAVRTSSPHRIGKGKYYLSQFEGIDNIGLDYSKCYFWGAGDAFIFLVTEKPVHWRGSETTNVRIDNGAETSIIADDSGGFMKIRYNTGGKRV